MKRISLFSKFEIYTVIETLLESKKQRQQQQQRMYRNVCASTTMICSNGITRGSTTTFHSLRSSYICFRNNTAAATVFNPSKYVVVRNNQASSSFSIFTMSTGSSGGSTGSNNNNHGTTSSTTSISPSSPPSPLNEQRRPFWATRPTTDEMSMDTISNSKKTTTTTKNTMNHTVNATATAVGISLEDIQNAMEKEKGAKVAASSTAVGATTKKKEAKTTATTTTTKKGTTKSTDDDDKGKDNKDADDEEEEITTDKDYIGKEFLTKVVATKHDVTKTKAKQIVDDIFDTIIDGIVEKKQVRISKLGIFSKSISKGRTMVNIQTKEKYQVPAKYRVSFKVSSTLKQMAHSLNVPAVESSSMNKK